MEGAFNRGVAIIGEGETELVFYEEYLKSLALLQSPPCSFCPLNSVGELDFSFTSVQQRTLIKMHCTNAVSQLPNASSWFNESCCRLYPSLSWSVVLAYDTDNYLADITKFHEGDWLRLRKDLASFADVVIDMAASADIEDVMLLDYSNVLNFIGLPLSTPVPSGRKGKAKMKQLFRLMGGNRTYRPGEKARPLIQSLSMERLKKASPLPFHKLDSALGISQ